jgi:hypothetical protein
MEDKELDGLLASIGAGLVAEDFMPQGSVPGLYVYEKRKKPSIVITILLLLLWIIPGIVYLLLAGGREVVSIQITELPLNLQVDDKDTVRLPVCLRFDINAPASIRNQINMVLAPFVIVIDRLIEHPEGVLVGKTFEKKVDVNCDHCGRPQEASIPFQIERVDGTRGYGPGGSITVTCSNPDCGKPFEVTWDNVIVELAFTA